jgi:two-component system, OmpR family, response regulator
VAADPACTRPGIDAVIRCGDLVLDPARWTVHRAGTPVDLSPTEFRLLACLMRHQGSVLTKSQLLQCVWGFGYTGHAQVVETYVSYLRRKLDRLGPPVIHTRRGAGYTLRSP